MKILLVTDSSQAEYWTEALHAHFPTAEVRAWSPGASCWNADYLLVWQPSEEVFATEKHLKAIFNLGAGVDRLLTLRHLPGNVPVIRLEDAGMSAQMAEYVVYQVVRLTRNMAKLEQQQQTRTWQVQQPIRRREWPVGVLGLGKIGGRVAKALAGLDYAVAGWSRSNRQVDGISCVAGISSLPEFLGHSQILINLLPLTPETRDILDRKHLSLLPRGAVLINVARGEHLVEQDLLDLLASGHLRAAVLDVFRQEPLPPGHPFWRHPAITITPHSAARTLAEETVLQISEKIDRLEQGLEVSGLVDLQRGY